MRILEAPQTPLATVAPAAATPHRNRFSVSRTAGAMPIWQPKAITASFAPEAGTAKIEAGQKLGFKDILDVINPLQHIPVLGAMYRKATGDAISAPAQFMGGMLFGGPLGAAAAMADIAIREQTGRNFTDTMLSLTGKNTAGEEAPVITMASRWNEPSRMAGTQPVWNGPRATPVPATVAPQTNFAILLNSLSTDTPHIS